MNNTLLHLVLDTGATASLIKEDKCKELKIPIHPTIHRAVQVDGNKLDVVGEIHIKVNRDKLELTFSALVVKIMSTDVLAGTGFHVENDVYSRMATDKIVVKGKYYFHSTPPLALTAAINLKSPSEKDSETTALTAAFTYPILVKANRSATLLPGEGFHVPIHSGPEHDVVEIDPRKEAPSGLITAHIQKIENETVYVQNMSSEPVKVKKNVPICQIKEMKLVKDKIKQFPKEDRIEFESLKEIEHDDLLSKIKMDPGNQLSKETKKQMNIILEENKEIFKPDLPGYNHFYGKIEATFEWSSKARPTVNRARMPDYNKQGTALYNEKARELIKLGVLRRAADLDIQPAVKNNSFLVKKQAATQKPWDQCTLKDVRLVTSFCQLQSFIKTIPAKVVKYDRILQACANWKFIAEFDLSNMFFQIPLRRSSSKDLKNLSYLCIQTDEGTLVYTRAPQGLPGISEYQEELTDAVIGDMIVEGKAVKWADNIYAGGHDEESFVSNTREVCQRLRIANLRASPGKTIIGIEATSIMGWHWNRGTLSPSVHKLNPLSVCEKPHTVKGLRSFLGGMRFHKRCLQGMDNITQPLDEACPNTMEGKEKIEWTEKMTSAFEECQKLMKNPKTLVVPRKGDQLVQVADGALHLPAIGSILVAVRPGSKECLPVGYFGFRVKDSMLNWAPCELEAYAHSKATEENSAYLRESNLPLICLTDNSSVVEASKKIKKGLYSASPRLQTLITAVQRYGIDFRHISGKLPTDLINVADFASRNPIECEAEGCRVCHMSKEPDTSFSTIRSISQPITLDSPISSRRAWKEIQVSCQDLREAVGRIQSGTKVRIKETGKYDVRKLIAKGSLSHDGLLVVNETLPMEIKPVQQIVVPRDYALSLVTLLHNDDDHEHPSMNQTLELIKRKYFIFDVRKIIEEVHNKCLRCASRKKISPSIVSLQTETKSQCPGTYCNADVLVRSKQKILLVRDNLTSFTQTKIVPTEQKEDLRTGLITMLYFIKMNRKATVRVDPHSTFKSLKDDKILKEHGITLDIGDEKNVNKNSVAEKGIQELEEELVKLAPDGQPVNELILAKATHNLNSRIRHTRRSAQELLMKRDQFTGESLEVKDADISDKQHNMRRKKNIEKISELKDTKEKIEYRKGDIVFVISDKHKHKERETYMVVQVEDDLIEVVKAKKGRTAGTKYKVKAENVYKALPDMDSSVINEEKKTEKGKLLNDQDKHSDIQEMCFYCKKCKYLDYNHKKEDCIRYKSVMAKDPRSNIREKQESDSESENEREDVNPDNATDNDSVTDDERENVVELDVDDENESAEDEFYEIEQEENENMEIVVEENPPVYRKPKKKDKIIYFTDTNDSWRQAVITSSIAGYSNSWFNIQHTDGTRCSVELSKDSLWRFLEEERNDYYRWRWHHIDPGVWNE